MISDKQRLLVQLAENQRMVYPQFSLDAFRSGRSCISLPGA